LLWIACVRTPLSVVIASSAPGCYQNVNTDMRSTRRAHLMVWRRNLTEFSFTAFPLRPPGKKNECHFWKNDEKALGFGALLIVLVTVGASSRGQGQISFSTPPGIFTPLSSAKLFRLEPASQVPRDGDPDKCIPSFWKLLPVALVPAHIQRGKQLIVVRGDVLTGMGRHGGSDAWAPAAFAMIAPVKKKSMHWFTCNQRIFVSCS